MTEAILRTRGLSRRFGGLAAVDEVSLACEMVKCECRPPKSSWSLSDAPGQPVQWRHDGSAYCRQGLSLTRLDK